MSYNENTKNATLKYRRSGVKTLSLRYPKHIYEDEILPAIEKTGKPVLTFVKEAVKEKIEREHLNDDI